MLGCGFGSFFLSHLGQALHLFHVESETFGNALSVLSVRFVEDSALAELDSFLGIAQMSGDIPDKVVAVHISHYPSVKLSRLEEIVIGVGIGLARCLTTYLERGFGSIGLRFRSAEAVGVVIGVVAAILGNVHRTVTLIVVDGVLRSVNGYHRIIYSQSVDMGVVVGKEASLQQLIR